MEVIKLLNTNKTLDELMSKKYSSFTHISNKVKNNSIFIALNGSIFKGSSYINEAINKGASLIISEDLDYDYSLIKNVPIIVIKNFRKRMASFLNKYLKISQDNLKVIGITGTNGKTTCSYILEHFLKNSTRIGTIGIRIKDEENLSKNTTPESIEILDILDKSNKKNVKSLIMEVSSHSLELNRVEFLKFDYAIFTNLTQDHLDFHKTIEEYFNAKLKLMPLIKENGLLSINLDNEYTKRAYLSLIEKEVKFNIKTFSLIDKKADYYGKIIEYTNNGMVVEIVDNLKSKSFKSNVNLIGRYNLENILACIPILNSLGYEIEDILKGLKNLNKISGRAEIIENNKGIMVIVDFAHTPDGLENILKTIKEFSKNRIIVVFGCGGNRDKLKRPKMAEAVSKYADIAVITSDNPRTEDEEKIIEDIEQGIKNIKYYKIKDRENAIKKALDIAKNDDVVLIAGKGHENYQIFKDKTVHFSDQEVVRKVLK